jgi:hypothetical protein
MPLRRRSARLCGADSKRPWGAARSLPRRSRRGRRAERQVAGRTEMHWIPNTKICLVVAVRVYEEPMNPEVGGTRQMLRQHLVEERLTLRHTSSHGHCAVTDLGFTASLSLPGRVGSALHACSRSRQRRVAGAARCLAWCCALRTWRRLRFVFSRDSPSHYSRACTSDRADGIQRRLPVSAGTSIPGCRRGRVRCL